MTKEEYREYMRKYRAEHREEYHARTRKRREEHREELRAKKRKYRAERREKYNAKLRKLREEHQEEYKAKQKKRKVEDLNANGVTKHHIRTKSRYILKRCHAKLKGYEIHHCFGYEDAEKFIYIPRELHLKIHQFLRDNNIPADIDHFNAIRELISGYTGYTYISS